MTQKEVTIDHTEAKAKMSKREDTAPPENGRSSSKPTNEYVLNVAFYSFVGFMSVQAVFALIANSEAMLADSEAMSVDAFTYLFNLWAERIKKEPQSGHDSSVVLHNYRQELRRLYLELIPPAISVATLIVVTVFTLRDAVKTMQGSESGEEDQDVDISIMLFFSGLNLLLDVVNVTCFARADSAFGLNVIRHKGVGFSESIRESLRTSSSSNADENSNLLPLAGSEVELETATTTTSFASSPSGQPNDLVNLNMCSAWTVSQIIVRCVANQWNSHFA
jgi:Co/Zn/Cd efflux system component